MVDRDLTAYMSRGIDGLVKSAMKTAAQNPRETAFLISYSLAGKKAKRRRLAHEAKGIHIPPFLIASITASCNLYCKGCYARANHMCGEAPPEPPLSDRRWKELFEE
ncbi:MAG: radical SAM protein, partial [Acetanaerobacterium sp.]